MWFILKFYKVGYLLCCYSEMSFIFIKGNLLGLEINY